MRAAHELGIKTVSIYSQEDRFSLHRMKADESYLVGEGKGPVEAYLDIDDIVRVALEAGADAVHPGYGFLSENPGFAEACAEAGITFIGPTPEIMRRLGNKVTARDLAVSAGVPVMPATPPLPADEREAARLAESVGYPVMLKASWGGGGRGMRVVEEAVDSWPKWSAPPGVRPRPRSATTRSISKSSCAARATSKCRSSAIATATSCTCSSATARCSAATRKSSSARRPCSWTTRSEQDFANSGCASVVRSAT